MTPWTRQQEATPYRVHLITHFDVAAGLCLPFSTQGVVYNCICCNIGFNHGDEEGMISGFAGADVETIASIMYE